MTLSEKIEKVLEAIELGKDATEVTDCCKTLTKKADLLQLILKLAALVQSATTDTNKVDSVDKNIAPTTNANADDDLTAASGLTQKNEEEVNADEEQVEARKKAEKKVEEAAQEAAKRKKKIKCRYFLKFGSLDKNEKGCKNGSKCPYFHPRLCRPALKGRCGDKGCGSHHLTAIKPPAREVKKTTTNNHSSSGNNNNKSRPDPNSSHHQTTKGPFLGQTGLNPPGSMEELAKIVTQMVLLSLNSMQQSQVPQMPSQVPQMPSQVPQMPPQLWGGGARWGL
jgi:chemotaxis protein histidine kinase CheA